MMNRSYGGCISLLESALCISAGNPCSSFASHLLMCLTGKIATIRELCRNRDKLFLLSQKGLS